PQRGAGGRVEDVDVAVAEVADEQVITEVAELGRGDGFAPGRVQQPAGREPLEQHAVGVVYVHETVPHAGNVVALGGVLLRVGDEKLAGEVFDVERGEARGDGGVAKVAGKRGGGESRVEDVNLPGPEIGSEEERAGGVRAQGETLVDRGGRVVHGQDGVS